MKAYILRSVIITLISTPIYLLIRRPWRFKDKREIALGVFIIYLICLFTFTLEGTYQAPIEMIKDAISRVQTGEYINLVPGRTMIGILFWASFDDIMVNDFSNIAIFIPWGFLLPLLWERFRSWKNLVPMCLGITVFIEIYQLFIWRNTDIDDIILNFLGGIIGGLIFFCLQKRKNLTSSTNILP